jgi:uncharacterized protein (DUF488 family)
LIYTVGHGARSAVAFVFLLQQSRIDTLVDVRAYPVSRRHPQFSRDALTQALAAAGIRYEWHGEALGGMRKGGYAPHMETPLFIDAAGSLIAASRRQRLCIMCAETQPADCHRAYISDWLVARGERVVHLIGPDERRDHAARLF